MTAGLAIMSMSATSPIGAVAAGQIMLRSSYRVTATIGGVFYIVGTVMMTLLAATSGPGWAMASGDWPGCACCTTAIHMQAGSAGGSDSDQHH